MKIISDYRIVDVRFKSAKEANKPDAITAANSVVDPVTWTHHKCKPHGREISVWYKRRS